MDFRVTPEQAMLRDQVRDLLAARLPHERLEAVLASDAGWDRALWAELAELGLIGIALPEAVGGAGLGLVEEVLVLEETGAALLPAPYLATALLAAPLLAARPELAREAAGGARTWTLAREGDVTAEPAAGGGWRLRGTLMLVPDLGSADGVVVVARAADGVGVWALTQGGRRTVLDTTDETRRLGVLELAGEEAVELVAPGRADEALAAARIRARVALAAEALGVTRRALAIGVEHARTRTQFGKAIGAYQAVAHPLADTYADLELARSLVWRAAWAVDAGQPDAGLDAALAKSFAADAAVAACERSIQVHASIGFTWEHPLQRLLKRAQGIAVLAGSGSALRAEIAAAVLDGSGALE